MNILAASTLAATCQQAGMTEDETAAFLYDNGFVSSTMRAEQTAAMSRRGFLKTAGVLAVGTLAPDPERALWTPDQRQIFVEKPKPVKLATAEQVKQLFDQSFDTPIDPKVDRMFGRGGGRRYGPFTYDTRSGALISKPTPEEMKRIVGLNAQTPEQARSDLRVARRNKLNARRK